MFLQVGCPIWLLMRCAIISRSAYYPVWGSQRKVSARGSNVQHQFILLWCLFYCSEINFVEALLHFINGCMERFEGGRVQVQLQIMTDVDIISNGFHVRHTWHCIGRTNTSVVILFLVTWQSWLDDQWAVETRFTSRQIIMWQPRLLTSPTTALAPYVMSSKRNDRESFSDVEMKYSSEGCDWRLFTVSASPLKWWVRKPVF